MSLLFMDGFSHYDVTNMNLKYDTVTNPTNISISSSFARYAGGNGVQIGVNSRISKLIPYSSRLVVGFALRVKTLPATGFYVICGISNAGGNQMYLGINSSGALSIYNATAVSVYAGGASNINLVTNSWYFIEWKSRFAVSITSGDVELKISGTVAATITPTGTNQTGTTANAVFWGQGSGSGANQLFQVSDVYILNDSGSVNNNYIGDRVVQTIWPDADGTYADFAVTGTGTDVDVVTDNPPDGDTSYISSATAGDKNTFAMSDLDGAPTVSGVQFNQLCKKDAAGTRVLSPMVIISGTEYVLGGFGAFDSYAYSPVAVDVSPATSSAWTYSEINGMESGITLLS